MPLDLSSPPFDFSILLPNRQARVPVEHRPLTLVDLVVGIGFAVVAYGPWIAGGVVGWHLGHGWWGAALGVGIAMVAQAALLFLVLPIVGLVTSRQRSRR